MKKEGKKEKTMWHKGYVHYHTKFNFSEGKRISPEKLIEDLKRLGVRFALCAGDHGDLDPGVKTGRGYFGVDVRQYQGYRETCLSVEEGSGVVLIPAPEMRFKFPPYTEEYKYQALDLAEGIFPELERHEHHTCVPILDYTSNLVMPTETPEIALSYTKEIETFIAQMHEHGQSLTLNHPYTSMVASLFSAPPPLSVPVFYAMDYFELITSLMDDPDFALYLQFLAQPSSAKMGCSASGEAGPENFTWLYVQGDLTRRSVLEAWNKRRSYVSGGNLVLGRIEPVPGKDSLRTRALPFIDFSVSSDKMITEVGIFRNGMQVYHDRSCKKNSFDLNWTDKRPLQGENHYIVHIQTENKHLVTSPVNYVVG